MEQLELFDQFDPPATAEELETFFAEMAELLNHREDAA
jgi:hypothetical protein